MWIAFRYVKESGSRGLQGIKYSTFSDCLNEFERACWVELFQSRGKGGKFGKLRFKVLRKIRDE